MITISRRRAAGWHYVDTATLLAPFLPVNQKKIGTNANSISPRLPPPPLSLSTCYFLFSCSAWQPLTSCHLASLPRPLILILIRRHQVRHLTAAQFVRSDLFIRSAKVAAIDAHQTADGQICCSIFRWKSVLAQIFLENLLTRLLST